METPKTVQGMKPNRQNKSLYLSKNLKLNNGSMSQSSSFQRLWSLKLTQILNPKT